MWWGMFQEAVIPPRARLSSMTSMATLYDLRAAPLKQRRVFNRTGMFLASQSSFGPKPAPETALNKQEKLPTIAAKRGWSLGWVSAIDPTGERSGSQTRIGMAEGP